MRRGIEYADRFVERTRFPFRIVVAEGDVVRLRQFGGPVASRGAKIGAAFDDLNARKALAQRRRGSIRGTVVRHDDGRRFG